MNMNIDSNLNTNSNLDAQDAMHRLWLLEQPMRMRQPGEDPPEPQCLVTQVGPHPRVARGRRVALVED